MFYQLHSVEFFFFILRRCSDFLFFILRRFNIHGLNLLINFLQFRLFIKVLPVLNFNLFFSYSFWLFLRNYNFSFALSHMSFLIAPPISFPEGDLIFSDFAISIFFFTGGRHFKYYFICLINF